jgi:hypothetical protein
VAAAGDGLPRLATLRGRPAMSAAELAMPEEDYEKLHDAASESAPVRVYRKTPAKRHKSTPSGIAQRLMLQPRRSSTTLVSTAESALRAELSATQRAMQTSKKLFNKVTKEKVALANRQKISR